MGGLPPLQVRENVCLVHALPESREGVVSTLAGIHRELHGYGRRSIHHPGHLHPVPAGPEPVE